MSQQAVNSNGEFDINLVKGVDRFKNEVLFMTGECQQLIGAEFQTQQLKLFPNATLIIIPKAGHEMFFENPKASITVVRDYLKSPAHEND